jgi:hypothetical protein
LKEKQTHRRTHTHTPAHTHTHTYILTREIIWVAPEAAVKQMLDTVLAIIVFDTRHLGIKGRSQSNEEELHKLQQYQSQRRVKDARPCSYFNEFDFLGLGVVVVDTSSRIYVRAW